MAKNKKYQEIIEKCEQFAKEMLPVDLHHGWEHVDRVRNYALTIGEQEQADMAIVEIAALLHDIGRSNEHEGEYHTEAGGRIAPEFLKQFDMPQSEKDKIVRIIKSHSRKEKYRMMPDSLEGKVVYDADGLDMVGAVGILRVALSASTKGKDWEHIKKKARWRLKIKDDFYTETGKRIAASRCNLLKEYVNQLLIEVGEEPI